MKTVSLTPREFRRMRRFIARPSGPTQAMIDLMNTSRQPTVEETLRAENARLQRIADAQPGFDNVIIAQLRAENAQLRDTDEFTRNARFWIWVERARMEPKRAHEHISCLAHHPDAPWQNGRWDVDHKPYAAKFYKEFPKASAALTDTGGKIR